MSGECYVPPPSDQPDSKSSHNTDKSKLNKLIEYESMVISAEDKCSQLKNQLERIKQLYANQTDLIKSVTKPKPTTTDFSKLDSQRKTARIQRQNSKAIGTDTTGAALGTINNILAGITKTIEMPQLFHTLNELNSKTSNDLGQKSVHGVENVKIHSKSTDNVKTRSKTVIKPKRTSSKLTSKASSSIFNKKIKKNTSENGQVRKPGIPMINMKSRKILRRIRAKAKVNNSAMKFDLVQEPNDLVEIYHNVAVKESKSSETDVPKKRSLEKTRIQVVPPLKINQEDVSAVGGGDDLERIEEVPRSPTIEHTSRNYELPTVSSRMKKVAKYYMHSFNIKSIPFCTVSSIGPSHNIGLNIQQVMSMVKNRQPALHLSPTLAYNIGLAAGKWQQHPNMDANPLNTLISSMTSRIYSHCPLTKSIINYQQLQEVAKTIPERIVEEECEMMENDDKDVEVPREETESLIITGPSGDVKVTNRKQTVWSLDPVEKKCTCVPQKGVEFQQIINKFNGSKSGGGGAGSSNTNTNHKFEKTTTNRINGGGGGGGKADEAKEAESFHNKEKKLKEVLKKLHDEFETMTKNYEDLQKKIQEQGGGNSGELTQHLEMLDKELNSKEEEIVMVMTLYKEVLALKQQVKNLKDKTSTCSFAIRNTKSNGDSNNTATATLLNKLLKQVQHFQSNYRKN